MKTSSYVQVILLSLLICATGITNAILHVCNQSRVYILVPEAAIPGDRAVALINFYDATQSEDVTLRLVRYAENSGNESSSQNQQTEVLSQNTSSITGNGVVKIDVPSEETGIYELQVLFNCGLWDEHCSLQSSTAIKLIGNVRDVIIRPSSNYYRPGEKIRFWLLAIDHSLQAPNDIYGNIYIRNPSGIIVASWEEHSLNGDSNTEYSMILSERVFVGKWIIEVVVDDGISFTADLNVSLSRGSDEPSKRDQVVAEKHFVELHFSDQMSRWYKPGLPLMGKVVAASSENEVRVRVKIIDDQSIVLYSQDIDMNGREGVFFVPAVITNTSKITAQAELISLGGKDVDSQYILAREVLYKWNSTSGCYLLMKNTDYSNLMPESNAEVTVLSSCPLPTDVSYAVITEGRITAWGDVKLINHSTVPVAVDSIMQGINICEFNISFKVLAEMAPLSRLLVYYNSKAGDITSDSISLSVKLQQDEISLILDQNSVWYAGERVKCGLISRQETQICLIGGQIDDSTIINRRLTPLEEPNIKFQKASNSTNIHIPDHYSFMPFTLMERIWIWKCFNYTTSVKKNGLTLPSPERAGKWNLWAMSVSRMNGLTISEPAVVNVVAPINVNFQLPKKIKVMEIVQVEINIVNSVNSCVDVHAVIGLNEGIVYPGIEAPVVSEKLRLGGNGATSVVVRIQPLTPGRKTMNVVVNYYIRQGCQETSYIYDSTERESSTDKDKISRTEYMEAIPEGVQRVQKQDAFFCANEYTLTTKSDDASFSFVSIPRNKYSAVMTIQAEKAAHIALSENRNVSEEMYQITLGDLDNSVSWIGHGTKDHERKLVSSKTDGYLSGTEKRTFWLSWDNNVLSIGRGKKVGNDTFLQHQLTKKIKINNIGFATNWGIEGTIILSIFSDESGFSQVIHMDLPNHVLPGTEKGSLAVTSGLNITSEINSIIDQPDIFPFSSVHTIISSFAVLFPLKYKKTEENLVKVEKNLQVLLQYMNEDYSFGDYPGVADFRTTIRAFAVLLEVRFYTKVNTDIIAGVHNWIINRQTAEGSFSEFQKNDTIDDKIENTAETLTIFLSHYFTDSKTVSGLPRAEQYLERNFQLVNNSYALAVTCYALTLSKSAMSGTVTELVEAISKNEEGEFEWPHPNLSVYTTGSSEWYYEDEIVSVNKKNQLMSIYISDYKASLYTLMVYCLQQNLEKAKLVAQYIFYHSQILNQHPELSLLTLKAVTEFGKLNPAPHSLLTISLATSGMELTDTIELKENQNTVLYPPTLPTKVFIYATGSGCSSVKGTVAYSTYDVTNNIYGRFNLTSVIEEVIPAHYNSIGDPEGMFPALRLKTCFRANTKAKSVRLEVELFSGYNLVSVVSGPDDFLYGWYDYRIWFVFNLENRIPTNCSLCVRYLIQSSFIITSLRPMYVQIYDTIYPHMKEEIFFHDSNKHSILTSDLTDKDFIVWFGNEYGGDGKVESAADKSDECVSKNEYFQLDLSSTTESDVANFSATEKFVNLSRANEIKSTEKNDDDISFTTTVPPPQNQTISLLEVLLSSLSSSPSSSKLSSEDEWLAATSDNKLISPTNSSIMPLLATLPSSSSSGVGISTIGRITSTVRSATVAASIGEQKLVNDSSVKIITGGSAIAMMNQSYAVNRNSTNRGASYSNEFIVDSNELEAAVGRSSIFNTSSTSPIFNGTDLRREQSYSTLFSSVSSDESPIGQVLPTTSSSSTHNDQKITLKPGVRTDDSNIIDDDDDESSGRRISVETPLIKPTTRSITNNNNNNGSNTVDNRTFSFGSFLPSNSDAIYNELSSSSSSGSGLKLKHWKTKSNKTILLISTTKIPPSLLRTAVTNNGGSSGGSINRTANGLVRPKRNQITTTVHDERSILLSGAAAGNVVRLDLKRTNSPNKFVIINRQYEEQSTPNITTNDHLSKTAIRENLIEPPLAIARDLKKIVVGQNELVFDIVGETTSPVTPTNNNTSTTTTNADKITVVTKLKSVNTEASRNNAFWSMLTHVIQQRNNDKAKKNNRL